MHTPNSWSRGLAKIAKRAGKLHNREAADMNTSAQTGKNDIDKHHRTMRRVAAAQLADETALQVLTAGERDGRENERE